MMEVEDAHAYRDADMIPEEGEWDDQIMQDDHQPTAIPEVEMGNEFADDDIEYDMEDASGHAEYVEEIAIVPLPVHPVNAAVSSSARPQTPLVLDISKVDVVFESPSHARTPEPSVAAEEDRSTHPTLPSTTSATATQNETEQTREHDNTASLSLETNIEKPVPPETLDARESVDLPEEVREPATAPSVPQDDAQQNSGAVLETHGADGDAAEEETAVDEASADFYPSPVLISSATSSHPSFYLFVQPDSSPDELVYLSDQPQLFYEPLQAVFEAIRALTDDLGIPEHVELGLYSEALDLNVTEVC